MPSQSKLVKLASLRAEICATGAEDEGKFTGSGYTVRDMLRIVDVLDDDGLLQYYGISYGTVLGVTLAAMFPDRVDRMVNDGNVNPPDWYFGK